MKIMHLNESISELSGEELKDLIQSDYSQAYEKALQGHYIFKGMWEMLDEKEAYYFEKIENRKSANTYNFYTVWINNSEDWAQFPKRNVIATTNALNASEYGYETFVILPKNGSKIGVCPKPDIWVSFEVVNRTGHNADEVMDIFMEVFKKFIKKIPHTFEELSVALKNLPSEEYQEYEEELRNEGMFVEDEIIGLVAKYGFYEAFKKMFSPEGFKLIDIKDYQSKGEHEVWFDSDFIAINYKNIKEVLGRLKDHP